MSEASRRIRDSIAALPDEERKPWIYHDDSAAIEPPQQIRVLILGDGRMLEAGWGDDMLRPREARHVALLASPHVAAAVADLLDAISEFRDEWDLCGAAAWAQRVEDRAEALEAAITRTGGAR